MLFETMAEPLIFATLDDDQIRSVHAAGIYVPPDDENDKRLADPHLVGLLTLASDGKPVSRLLITAADPAQARDLRSYWDERRDLAVIDARTGSPVGLATAEQPSSKRSLALELSWAAAGLQLRLPIGAHGLERAGAPVPPGLQIAPW